MKNLLYTLSLLLLLLCSCDPGEYLDTNPHNVFVKTEFYLEGMNVEVDVFASNVNPVLIEEWGLYWQSKQNGYSMKIDTREANVIKAEGGQTELTFKFFPWDKPEEEAYYNYKCGVVVQAYVKLKADHRDYIYGDEIYEFLESPVFTRIIGYKTKFSGNDLLVSLEVESEDDNGIEECGIYWGEERSSDYEKNYKKIVAGDAPGEYDVIVRDVARLHYTYLVSYTKTKDGVIYSSIDSVRAPGGTITVSISPEAKNVTDVSATVSGSCVVVDNEEMYPIQERGFCYNTTRFSNDPADIWDIRAPVALGEENFTTTLTGLDPSTTYKVRAYAMNETGVYYSKSQVMVYTSYPKSEIEIITAKLNPDIPGQVILEGQVISDKGYYITERGFCYSKIAPTPTIYDSKMIAGGDGLGTFSATVNLSSGGTYYFNAYGRNSRGTSYSKVITVVVP